MSKQHLKILATALALSTSALILSSCSTGVAGTYPKKPVSVDTNVSVILPQPEKTPEPTPPNKEDQADQPQPQPPEPEPEEPKEKVTTNLTLPTLSGAISSQPINVITINNPTTTKSDIQPNNNEITPSNTSITNSYHIMYNDIGSDRPMSLAFLMYNRYKQKYLGNNYFTEKQIDANADQKLVTNANIADSTTPDVLDSQAVGNLLDYKTSSKANSELGKVLLLGDDLTSVSDVNQTHVSKDYAAPLSHADNITLSETTDSLIDTQPVVDDSVNKTGTTISVSEIALQGLLNTQKIPGLLSKNGEVAVLAPGSKTTITAQDVYATVNDTTFSDLVKKNYNVVAVTFAPHAVTLDHIKQVVKDYLVKDTDPNYDFEKRIDNGNFLGALDELGILKGEAHKFYTAKYNEVAKSGVFFSFATGEEEGYNPFALSIYNKSEPYTALQTGSVFVTTNSTTVNSTPCGEFTKYYCLTAYSDLEVNSKEADKDKISVAGSAYATAYVAGAASLVKTVFPFFTPENIQTTLLTTAKDIGESGIDAKYGWGLVQPQDAVQGPKQILNGKFVVDLSNNKDLVNSRSYAFNNAISGIGDLVVKANENNSVILEINNDNTFTGTTYITDSALVELKGSLDNVEISNKGHLYGDGIIKGNLTNRGIVSAFSNKHTKSNTQLEEIKIEKYNYSSQNVQSLYVKGNYKQDSSSTLEVFLGAPLMVDGTSTLAGKLVVKGIAKSAVFGKNFEITVGDIVISKNTIQGTFDDLTIDFPRYSYFNEYLLQFGDQKLVSNPYPQLNEFNSISLSLGIQLNKIIKPSSDNYNILLASAQDNVNSELQTHNLVLSSSDFEGYVAANEVVENTIAKSPLTDLAASLKVSFDDKMIQESSKLFQGTEFTEAVEHNQMLHQAALSKATNQLFSFDADGKTNSTVSTDYLAASNGSTSYLTAVNANYQLGQHKLALGVNQGGSSWKHSQASDKNKHTTFGGTVGYATQLAQEFGVNAYAGYQHSSNDLVRNLTILDTPYNHNDKLVVNETVLGANFFYNVPVPAQFQVFLGANQHWSNTSAVTEQYGKEDQAYRLELGKNSVNYTNLVVGAHFTQGNLLGTYGWQGLDLDASYELAYSLNHWNELNAQLADNVLTVKQTYARNNPSNLTHQAALSLTQQLDKTFSVGAKASLLSGSETYKALGLYLNARF